MRRVALRGIAGRKLRSLLTGLAIVLGVAMVSGTFVLTDTIDQGYDTVFTESYGGADAVISESTAFGKRSEGTGGFPASLLDRVEDLPSVEAAAGSVVGDAQLFARDGEELASRGTPLAFGLEPESDERLNPLRLVDGEWPRGGGEIAIDKATAEEAQLTVGDPIRMRARGPAEDFRIAGIVQLGSVESVGSGSVSAFSLETAQRLFGKDGRLDLIQVAGAEGVAPGRLVEALRTELPPTAEVRTADAQAQTDSSEAGGDLGFLRYFLLAFAAIALFVASFVIANTLSITIGQRTRELATLRTLGASRRQVLSSVILEALVVGVLASIAGLLLGVALAFGLEAMVVAVGIDLPSSGMVFSARTAIVSLLVGIVITLIASIRPALRATRVPPIAAVREGSVLPPSRFARFGFPAAVLVTASAVSLLALGSFVDSLGTAPRLFLVGLGAILLFLGVALVAPRLVRPLASALGWPATRVAGPAGNLARANAMRNPARTASTAAALMIGLALVTFVAVLAQGLRSTFVDSVEELFVADYAITAEGGAPLDPGVERTAAQASGVAAVSGIRMGEGRVAGAEVGVAGVDENIVRMIEIQWHRGSDAVPADLGTDGAFVKRDYAEEEALEIGSRLELATPTGKILRLTVEGIWEEPKGGSPFGEIEISHAAFDANFPEPGNAFTFVNSDGGSSEANTAALKRELAAFPDADLQTQEEFKDAQVATLTRVLNVLYVLLALSVIVSLFGLVNTLVLTVFERTRELGMLRAVGMTRQQVRRMIRHESIVTALIGAALGIVAGIFLAALVTQALSNEGFAFAVPVASLVVFVVAAILVGVVAAILPARRASRLNILEALQYE